eukprot:6196025-Pleurochrysis_carterae.AAC.3
MRITAQAALTCCFTAAGCCEPSQRVTRPGALEVAFAMLNRNAARDVGGGANEISWGISNSLRKMLRHLQGLPPRLIVRSRSYDGSVDPAQTTHRRLSRWSSHLRGLGAAS